MTTTYSPKISSDSDKKDYESSRTDSGFLSGTNLVSEECLTNEDSFAKQSTVNLESQTNLNYEKIVQTDSGVDIDLNEQFSGLALEENFANNLNENFKNICINNKVISKTKHIENDENNAEIRVTQPWELYFQQDEDGDT